VVASNKQEARMALDAILKKIDLEKLVKQL